MHTKHFTHFLFTPFMEQFSRAQMDTWVTGRAADQSPTTAWCGALEQNGDRHTESGSSAVGGHGGDAQIT